MRQKIQLGVLFSIIVAVFVGCTQEDGATLSTTLFHPISPDQSGVHFANNITETDTLNYFNYGYIYMGGGVSVADFNNDGLPDIYFTGNMVENKLYLNKGDLVFEDITYEAAVQGGNSWMQGSTICDVNSDGLLDIYVSVSGNKEKCENLLFVNKGINEAGVPIFAEEAKKYGIADAGHSTNSTFFDYDNDGDLDLYVANYPITSFKSPTFYYVQMMRTARLEDSNHLYENNGDGTYTDVTKDAGVLCFSLSLSATVSDFNNDGYKDIYVSNDFVSPDLFYMNNGDGTFTERVKELTSQTSFYGMGADVADFNNDGLMDIIQVDMAPEDNRRSKTNMSGMNPSGFDEMVSSKLHYQYMYNSLQLNRGLGSNGMPRFSNLAWMAGTSSTDWSWAVFFADFDNDGWKDIFVSNGTRRDINDNDYFKELEKKESTYFKSANEKTYQLENVRNIPSEAIANYVFRNQRDLTFSNETKSWGLGEKSFSNGAVAVDLDNDGDLELVVNNLDSKASVYRNMATERHQRNYIKVGFDGAASNRLGLGSRVTIWSKGDMQVAELTISRGFQSSMEPVLNFGLGDSDAIDSLTVIWPDGKTQTLNQVEINTKLMVNYQNASFSKENIRIDASGKTVFKELSSESTGEFVHQENDFNDFDHQVLLPHKMSNFGPAMATGDINQDGLDDLFVGGAVGQIGVLLIQNQDGGFSELSFQKESDKVFEDIDAVFVDIDNDDDLDLYIVSGGNEYETSSLTYQDRLFINESGTLTKSTNLLPEIYSSGSCVRPYDYDGDGDLDFFIGGRLSPRNYPFAGQSYLLESKLETGQLSFENVTMDVAPGLSNIGMVTDGLWTDINNDGNVELMVVGEWMPLTVFGIEGGMWVDQTKLYFDGNTTGWWFSIDQADFDQDGDMDYVAGNLGLNYKYRAKPGETFNMYADDFDNNGSSDIVLSYYNYGEEFPVRGRQCSSEQIPAIKTKFKNYQAFSTASVTDIFGESNLEKATSFKVESFESVYIENSADGRLKLRPLPNLAQISPINDLLIDDYNADGHLDLIVAGNLYASEVETPRADAGIGLLMLGNGSGTFTPQAMAESGICIPYDTKKLSKIQMSDNVTGFAAANNNGPLQLYIAR